jgi:hypothetical protein
VAPALRAVGVDVACLPAARARAIGVLRAAGYGGDLRAGRFACLRRQ